MQPQPHVGSEEGHVVEQNNKLVAGYNPIEYFETRQVYCHSMPGQEICVCALNITEGLWRIRLPQGGRISRWRSPYEGDIEWN